MRKKEKDKDITNRKIRNEEFQKEIKILDARLHNKQITDSAYKEEVAKLVQKDIEWSKSQGTFFIMIGRYFKSEWKLASMIVFLTVVSVLASVVIPLLTRQMTLDITNKIAQSMPNYVRNSDFWGLGWETTLAIALGVVLGNAVISFLSQYVSVLLSKRIEIDLRNKALEALVRQDISYYSDKKIGEIITKVISDTQIVGDQSAQVPVILLSAVLTIIGASIMMFLFEATLAACVLGMFFLILVAMTIAFGERMEDSVGK